MTHYKEVELPSSQTKSFTQKLPSSQINFLINLKATIETYLTASSWLWGWLGILWMMVFNKIIMYEPLRRFCQNYPEVGSCGMFSSQGPSREQCKQVSFF